MSRGLKPDSVVGCSVQAKAWTYLRSKCKRKGKSEIRGFFASLRMTKFCGGHQRTGNDKRSPSLVRPTLRDSAAKDGAPVDFWLVEDNGQRQKLCSELYGSPTIARSGELRMGHPAFVVAWRRTRQRQKCSAYLDGVVAVVVFSLASFTRAFSSLCWTLDTSAGSASAGREWAYSVMERSHWATASLSLPVFS
jgi:hypothetical protein